MSFYDRETSNRRYSNTMTPFITILTPLSYFPVLFGMFIGAWGCLTIILRTYGLDLATAVPMISGELNIVAPLFLLGVAAFGIIQGAIVRKRKSGNDDVNIKMFGPLGWLECLSIVSALFALITVPYWLQAPFPEIWIVAIGALAWVVWRRQSN